MMAQGRLWQSGWPERTRGLPTGARGIGGTRPVIQIPLGTCNKPLPIWRPAWGTERRLEAQPQSLRFSGLPRGVGRQRNKKVGATRTALTVPLHQSQTLGPLAHRVVAQVLAGSLVGRGRGHSPQDSLLCEFRFSWERSSENTCPQLSLRGSFRNRGRRGDTQTQGQETAGSDPRHRVLIVLG